MSSFINKFASSVTNTTGSIIGRENLTNLTNSINRGFVFKSKYRDYIKPGNVVQLVSKNSHMALQICASRNDPNRLILLGNGPVGIEYLNAHFLIEMNASNSHLKFRNRNNFMAYDNDIPCILEEKLNPKNNKEAIRARNEFRLHEIIGSQEHFALESVYYPGRYLSVMPDGSITSTRNKAEPSAHFCLHIINVVPTNMRPNSTPFVYTPPVVSVSEAASANPAAPVPDVMASSSSNRNSQMPPSSSKEEEAQYYATQTPAAPAAAAGAASTLETPPSYSNLFPKLPQ